MVVWEPLHLSLYFSRKVLCPQWCDADISIFLESDILHILNLHSIGSSIRLPAADNLLTNESRHACSVSDFGMRPSVTHSLDIMASTNGLVWFITGVSSGIGAAIAIYALNRGQHVVGTVRSRDRATGMVKSIENKGGICLELDVTDADGAKETYQRAEALHGRVDVLVNNAGYSLLGATEDIRYVLGQGLR